VLRTLGQWALCAGLALAAATSAAGTLLPRLCDRGATLDAAQQDRLLRLAAVVKRELEASGQAVALISRSGLDLSRFGIRYSHAGISLKASENTPWSVRQLYFACDEGRSRLYDQGLGGFLLGTDDPSLGYVSIVLLPAGEAAALESAALDKALALRLLTGTYSANAYAYGLRYQNCNQWVIELLAAAFGRGADGHSFSREDAQRWLAEQGYAPEPVEVGSRALMFAGAFVPWLRMDDHPEEDVLAMRFRTTLPATIESFIRSRLPLARRIELCHDQRQIVIHRGWTPIAEGCRPQATDEVVAYD
jgi:hypothetical protein